MAAARVRTNRFVLKWGEVQRAQGSYDWARGPDHRRACLQGIRSVPFVWGTPAWVGTGSRYPPIGGAAERQAWQNFLKAAVGRYGPGGSYWANKYRQRYGQSATPLPIQSWQIWNEPNLKKYFAPGSTTMQAKANKYARLLQISHDAIKAKDPKATIVLAGMPGNGDRGSRPDFLNAIYSGSRGQVQTSTSPPCTPTRATWIGSARGSQSSAR